MGRCTWVVLVDLVSCALLGFTVVYQDPWARTGDEATVAASSVTVGSSKSFLG
jgi:hypothetical protein